jgi:hypothetical protein
VPNFSIVSVISRPEIFDSCLLASINENRRNHDVEILPIFNEANRYSASNALNIGLDVARSDIVIFAHQDVRLLYRWFDRLAELIKTIPSDWGVLGSAGIGLEYSRDDIGKWGGALKVNTVAVGSVWDSDESLGQVPYWDGVKDLTPIHCADECVLVVNKKTGLRFDAQFTGFHFYGVDLCLQARAAGYAVYGAHLPIVHYGKYSASFSGDGDAATSATLSGPYGVAVDTSGTVYIADYGNNRVRKVMTVTTDIPTTAPSRSPTCYPSLSPHSINVISTFAGTGVASYSGDGGQATVATVNQPLGIATDSNGNVFISEGGSNRIRKVTVSTGIITTLAGNGGTGSFSGDNGPATAAFLNGPTDIALDSAGTYMNLVVVTLLRLTLLIPS